MLELKNICKVYEVGNPKEKTRQKVKALKKVSINFRKSEFVSILGPSGCGKTTLLNIIGGLDKYSHGDLVIDGKSTKKFTDKDWDTYRNHKVGFVFQSYNLIPHLDVFENVELALTLSGIPKKERIEKVKTALKKVGLADKIYAKPNQLSGGQMQRVAIARALINDPEIILADEPTGALDSKTSVQIMNLLKEISKDKLIVMVTHNPELAEAYSTRIINLFDGEVVEDSMPFTEEKQTPEDDNKNKKSMSFFTALSLSFKNLLTKKARTMLVAFAGSIGIIGIALILAVSSSFQNYINDVQETTLTSYPLSISRSYNDYTSLLTDLSENNESPAIENPEKVYSEDQISTMLKMLTMMQGGEQENKIDEFVDYIENQPELAQLTNDIVYDYDYAFNVYGQSEFTGLTRVEPSQVFKRAYGEAFGQMFEDSGYQVFGQLYNNLEFLHQQYDLVYGDWPVNSDNKFGASSYNQVVLILDENNKINDYYLYALGLKNQKNLPIHAQISAGYATEDALLPDKSEFEYSEIVGKTFSLVTGDKYYTKNGSTWEYYNDFNENQTNLSNFVNTNKLIDLEVVGIIKAKNGDVAGMLNFAMGFTPELFKYLSNNLESNMPQIIQEQLLPQNKTINILTNQPFTGVNNINTNLRSFGYIDLNSPDKLKFYVKTYEDKEKIMAIIDTYNTTVLADPNKGEDYEIKYTDYVGMLMSNVSTIINAITYVLIAFVSISLVVSSIMIGIITYISVLERIKEIGVLRSIGASKRDIKRVFTAESLIIGFIAGALGIIITLLLCIPINLILASLAGISGLAKLPVLGAIILIVLSMLLTFIAGLIPAKIASKKDPVIALRSE